MASFLRGSALVALSGPQTDRLRQLAALLDAAPAAVLVRDADSRIMYWNHGAERLYGYEAHAAVGQTSHDLLRTTFPQSRAATDSALAVEGSWAGELTHTLADGARIVAYSQQSLHRDSQGQPLAILEINSDITERKRAAVEAQRFFALSLGLFVTLDSDGYFRRVNPACTRVLGWSEEELAARPFLDFVHPDDQAATLALAQRLSAEGGDVVAFENRYRCRDGSYRWLSWNTTADPVDGVLFGAAQDITERKQAYERQAASAQQAVRLQRVTAALGEALTVEDVNAVVVGEGLVAVRAEAGSIAILDRDGASIRLGRMKGYSKAVELAWDEIPLEARTPLTDAVRLAEPVCLRNPDEFADRYPHLTASVEASRHRSWAALPLVSSGRTLGALGLSWNDEQALTEQQRVFMLTVAASCAQALERAQMYELQRTNAARASRIRSVAAALSEALTVDHVTAVVAEQVNAALGGSGLIVSLVGEDGRLRPALISGYGEAVRAAVAEIDLDSPQPLAEVVRRREPLLFESRAAYLERFPQARQLVEHGGRRAWAFLPLVASGRVIGSWAIGFDEGRVFTDEDRELLVTLARLCAQALERARLYEREHATAVGLQRSLLPYRLPELASASVSTRYEPGGAGVEVGGDWYDVMHLPNGHIGVCVGDVEGHSVRAAALMGKVRSALRAYAIEGHSPTVVIERTNTYLFSLDVEQLVTCCYLELDPGEGTATVVTAGHPPPLLIPPYGPARYVEVEPGLPLGVQPEGAAPDSTIILAAGSTLVLYTDGLVEGPALPLQEGLDRLRAAATQTTSTEGLADLLLRETIEHTPTRDDVALVALRYTPEGEDPGGNLRNVRRKFSPEAASVSAGRRFVADVLTQWGTEGLCDSAVLLVSELLTNAVRYATKPLDVHLYLSPEHLLVEVADDSDRLPEVQSADDDAMSGRGLQIVEAVADAWGTAPRGVGKAVWFHLAREGAH